MRDLKQIIESNREAAEIMRRHRGDGSPISPTDEADLTESEHSFEQSPETGCFPHDAED